MLFNNKIKNLIIAYSIFFSALAVADVNTNNYPDLANLPKPAPLTAPALSATPPPAPQFDVKGYILIDANSGKVLGAQNPDARLQPASLTKLMTLYVISNALQSGRIHLDDLVPISEKAWKTGGSRMFVQVGDRVAVRDLIQGIIVDSGNDACVAMAEYVAGTEDAFANLMNQQAQALGMTNSHFLDSTGLPNPNHYTSPHDLAILARALIQHFPSDYQWYKQKWFTYNKIRQPNRNRLLWWDNTVDGLKTGHTDEAGFCLVGSAERHGMRLIGVMMGAPSDNGRASDTQKLLNYGFSFYETHKLYAAGAVISRPRIWKGQETSTPFGLTNDVYVTIPAGQYRNLTAQLKTAGTILAPIIKDQSYGQLVIELNGKPYMTEPLIALADNPQGGWFHRMSDAMKLSFHKMFGKKDS